MATAPAATGDIFKSRGIGVFNNIETPALITVSGGSSMDIMCMGFSGQAAESYQAVKSFTEHVYITTFGQALSMFQLQCLTLPESMLCKNAKANLSSLKDIYKNNRIGNPSRPILTITLDNLTIKGFLIAMPITTKSVAGLNSIGFTLNVLGQVIL